MLNLRNIEILLAVMSHFNEMSVKILVYSLLVLRDYSSSKLELPWQLKEDVSERYCAKISSAPLVVQLQTSRTT